MMYMIIVLRVLDKSSTVIMIYYNIPRGYAVNRLWLIPCAFRVRLCNTAYGPILLDPRSPSDFSEHLIFGFIFLTGRTYVRF